MSIVRKNRLAAALLVPILLAGSPGPTRGQAGDLPVVLSLASRAQIVDSLLTDRLNNLLPGLMREQEIDMWIVSAREYNEDPVIRTMIPARWLAARRRTILVMFDPGAGRDLEYHAIARYDVGKVFVRAWDKEKQPDQWARLAELIAEKNPKRIALNTSATYALADGMTHAEYAALLQSLPETFRSRIVSGERLAVRWLETRTEAEMRLYPSICRIAHRIIAAGLSEAVIQPGVTSTEQVSWWYREKIAALKLETWFHPSVSVQRSSASAPGSFASRPDAEVIHAGDLIHVDFGITYLRLNTDTQQHAYVLRPGERQAPEGLRRALAVGNRLQDILTAAFAAGRSGNEILRAALDRARDEGITASIYTHPIGFNGHAAGPTIGLWDQQGGVPGRGDYPLFANTAHSIELNATVAIPEWQGQKIRIMLEEDAFFDGREVRYIDGRQTELWLIPRY